MPTVTFQYDDLIRLLGKKIPVEKLKHTLTLVKCEVKSIGEGTVTAEVNPDRPDMFSLEGITRTLKGFLNIETGYPSYDVRKSKLTVYVKKEVSNVRPFIVAGIVKNVKFTDEFLLQIIQLQEKLDETLARKRKKASIGVYDLDKVQMPFIYTALKPSEIIFVPLSESQLMTGSQILSRTVKGKEYAHILAGLPRYPLLHDKNGTVLSMPPIINSEDTRVTTSSCNLFIDVTGFHEPLLNDILNILVSNIAERKGTIETVKIVYPKRIVNTPSLKPARTLIDIDYLNLISGLKLNSREAGRLAERMRYKSFVIEKKIQVSIPPYRCDVLHSVDLIEDIIIAYGYDKIKPQPMKTVTYGKELPKSQYSRKVRDLMVGFSFQEVASYILTSMESQTLKMELQTENLVRILNPRTSEFAVLRRLLLPGLLGFLSYNTHIDYPQRIFECGEVVIIDEEAETKTRSELKLSAAICDYKISFESIQSVVFALLKKLGVKAWEIRTMQHPSFITGRTASISLKNEEIVILGEVHPKVLGNFGIPNPTAAFEMNLETLQHV